MQNHCEKTSPADVMPALAKVIGRHDKEDFTEAPGVIQEMFNRIMDTPYGDNLAYRQRMLLTLAAIQDFGEALEPFSQETINTAVSHV